MLGRTNAVVAIGGGTGTLNVIAATELPSAALGTACVIVGSGVTAESIHVKTTEPAHANNRVWVEIEDIANNCIGGNGGTVFRLKRAWISDGTNWLPCDGYYTLYSEWIRFSWEFTTLGIEWGYGNQTPLLTRTGDAVGANASAGVGSVAGESDFDDFPIFSEIRRCNLSDAGVVNAYESETGYTTDGSNGQVMVEIPAFYYKAEIDTVNVKYRYSISNHEQDGYALHPMFQHNGETQNAIYIAAYETSAGYASKSGAAPLVSQTRAVTRTGIRGARGNQWSTVDMAARVGIGMLMVIEFATLNTQSAIGPGISGASAASTTGGADGVAGSSGRAAGTANLCAVAWRGLENWWGNVWEWVDGFNVNGGVVYHCLNQLQFADDTASNYTSTGVTFGTALSAAYGTMLACPTGAPWAAIPNAHSGGSDATYLCDACYSSTGWRVALAGGDWSYGANCGAFAWNWNNASSNANANIGSRIL